MGMDMSSKKYDKVFLTGCDENTEWMLPWFVENYKKHNDTPLIFANFGCSEKTQNYVFEQFHAILNFKNNNLKGWFMKPLAMMTCPSVETVWIDTDCEVLDNISDIFSLIENEKLLMAEDRPWSKRRKELWHNSGIVGFRNKPQILRAWLEQVKKSPVVGDQEVLHSMLNPISKLTYIKDLPSVYNWLRLDLLDGVDSKKKKVIHWTGKKGKDHIRSLMNG
jgi:hypothetical protein